MEWIGQKTMKICQLTIVKGESRLDCFEIKISIENCAQESVAFFWRVKNLYVGRTKFEEGF